jgi:hypothetical protein
VKLMVFIIEDNHNGDQERKMMMILIRIEKE